MKIDKSLHGVAALLAGVIVWSVLMLTALLLLTQPPPPVRAQGPYYVRQGGTGTACTLADPCGRVHQAIELANDGDTINVATGVYTDSAGTVAVIAKSVTLLGGWDSTFSTRDPHTYPTILDAQRMGSVVYITSPVTTTPISPRIEGFVITGGDASLGPYCLWEGEGCGGGIVSMHADPAIVDNVIADNVASTRAVGYGGGIFLAYASPTAVISGNQVLSNTASSGDWGMGVGGGIMVWSGAPVIVGNVVEGNIASTASEGHAGGILVSWSAATVLNNTIQDNTASTAGVGDSGGLQFLQANGSLAMDNTIANNKASLHPTAGGLGGGFHALWTNSFTFTNNLVYYNQATDLGGGLLLTGSSFHIAENHIEGNTAHSGGGIALADDTCTGSIESNVIVSNTATERIGGGIMVGVTSTLSIQGNLIAYNSANAGGGVAVTVEYAQPLISSAPILTNTATWFINNLIVRNSARGNGGGLLCNNYAANLINNTIVQNSADGNGDGIGVYELAPDQTVFITNTILWANGRDDVDGSSYSICYSDVEEGIAGTGNFSFNPLFVNMSAGDYHLRAGSPCIDTGTSLQAPQTDLDGKARPVDGNSDGVAGWDVGAYEFQPRRLYLSIVLNRFLIATPPH